MTNDTWARVLQSLRTVLGANSYSNWIEPLEFDGLAGGVATLNAPTTFIGNYVKQNFSDLIIHKLREADQNVERLSFAVGSMRRATAAANTVSAPAPAPRSEASNAGLDDRFTFDTFVVGKPNELAHAAARRVAEGGPVSFNPLFLYGGVGLGKTHLMHAIAHELRGQQPHLNVLYLSAEQFMYRFITALRDRKMMDFKDLFRSVDILMVDDVQFLAGKDSTQEEFFHTFNALVDAGKQIIISADRAPGEIKDLEERIKSRLQCGLVVDLHPTDYELRLGVLQAKAEAFAPLYQGIEVADGVLEFLRLSDMIGPKRVRTLARPRQIAMYLAKNMTSRSLPEIGRRFGGRDHTTVMHGVKKIEELKATDSQMADDVELLRRALSE